MRAGCEATRRTGLGAMEPETNVSSTPFALALPVHRQPGLAGV